MAQYAMVLGMFKHVAANREKISGLIQGADNRARGRAESLDPESDVLAVTVEVQPCEEPVTIKTWEGRELYTDEQDRRRVRPQGERIDVTVPYYGKFVATRTVPLPACYAFDSGELAVAEKLLQHGIVVEKLKAEATVTIQRFHITELKSAEMMYQGHIFTSLTGEWKEEEMTLGAGTYIVRTAQPLGMLAAYLLEPESDDGLTTWNYFDRRLMRQWGRRYLPHPVVKIMQASNLQTTVTGL
jgi:hypothetical protein